MTMTVLRMHKMLGALIEAGHGRKPVLVDRASFSDPRDNDGVILLPPRDVQGPRWIPNADDDGGTKWNRDGSESGQQCVLIVGDCAEPEAPDAGVLAVDDQPNGPQSPWSRRKGRRE
jgi:hypothetical protein